MNDKKHINLVQIQNALGIPLTGSFITETLGVAPDHQDKRALFWNADRYGMIHGRLANYLNSRIGKDPSKEEGARPKKVVQASAEDFFDDATPDTNSNEEFF